MSAARRRIGVLVCLVTIVLAVLDLQIVSAATVPIVRDLDPVHGIDRFPWLISAFALASAAMLPLYGKLCDTLGAQRVFLGAVATFLLGSALCGAAQSMDWLIAARAVQGLGGGGLMSITMVVVAHLKDPDAEDGDGGGGRSGGIGGIVAGGGMALGPWLGGFLTDHASWRWIFYVNLPLGLAVLAVGAVVLKLPDEPVRRPLDWAGAGLAAAFSTALLLATDWGGKKYAWSSPETVGLLCAAVAALALFLWRQTRAAEPVLPLSLFRIPELRWGFAVQGITGAAMMCAIYYVLVYLQVVRGLSSSSAGLFLLPMAVGMTAVGLLVGRLRASARTFTLSGTLTMTAVFVLLATTLRPDTSLWLIRAELLLAGAGFGQLIGQLIQLVQDAAPRPLLGVATTSIRFFQTLGNALGAALFGTVLFRLFTGDVNAIPTLDPVQRASAVTDFVHATDTVFWCGAALMLLATLLATRLPARRGADAPALARAA
ncbi:MULTISPECIES: MFS transporter [unclassified Streptomyces]|uniref:MFS transporter n=1 Tax=unclassified Streptomyces TaxID=2593676 RepID=UPI000DB9DD95|nr:MULTISPECIES: MFS transporter [unclassified Streptomyces]MYT73007.1 MFS transporter [Streptomyces sp. SID8367]RAJ73803.1 EmrB/QacA subfamily drug resistance transporter [Streptomyces sp. PsTaAH-137]